MTTFTPSPRRRDAKTTGAGASGIKNLNSKALLDLLINLDSKIPLAGGDGKIVLFTSCHSGEGKSTIIKGLCDLLAKQNKRVLIVDGGANHALAGLSGRDVPDLSQLVAGLGKTGEPAPTAKIGLGNSMIATVNLERDILSDRALDPMLAGSLRKRFDYVLIELPALEGSSLAASWAKEVDGAVLVLQAGRTRWPVIRNVQDQFSPLWDKIIGVALNKRRYFIPSVIYRWL